VELQDAFEVGEQHLDLFALTARGPVRLGLGNVARHIASALVDGARDLAGGCLRTALRFQGTRLAIQLAGAIAHHAVLIDERARHWKIGVRWWPFRLSSFSEPRPGMIATS